MWANPYSAESQTLTKHNATNRAPPTWPWGQRLINCPDAALIRPYQGQVAECMAYGEGGGAGDCGSRFLGVEEGGYSDRRIHHVSYIYFPKKELYATKRIVLIT